LTLKLVIGDVKTSTIIYFDKLEVKNTNNSIPVDSVLIRKVDVTIQSGSYLINSTSYFSEKDEFQYHYYLEVDYECYQKSYYFKLDKCIQMAQHMLTDEDCNLDSGKKEYASNKLNKTNIHSISLIYTKVKSHKNNLRTYYDALRYSKLKIAKY